MVIVPRLLRSIIHGHRIAIKLNVVRREVSKQSQICKSMILQIEYECFLQCIQIQGKYCRNDNKSLFVMLVSSKIEKKSNLKFSVNILLFSDIRSLTLYIFLKTIYITLIRSNDDNLFLYFSNC